MSNHKSCGLDEITTESWKTRPLSNVLLLVYNKAFKGDIPTVWKQVAIIPLLQKGNLSLPENYRGISLTSLAAKIYNQVILSCFRPHTDPLLWTNQNGFCQGRSTVSQNLTLHHVIAEVKEHNLSAILTFVDFKKAFNSINRDKMFDCCLRMGFHPKLSRASKDCILTLWPKWLLKMATQISFQLLLDFYKVTHWCHTYSSLS